MDDHIAFFLSLIDQSCDFLRPSSCFKEDFCKPELFNGFLRFQNQRIFNQNEEITIKHIFISFNTANYPKTI